LGNYIWQISQFHEEVESGGKFEFIRAKNMENIVNIKTIQENEITLLSECLRELAHHHNMVSINFSGYYPRKSCTDVLESFCEQLKTGTTCIVVLQENDNIVGFCKCDTDVESKQGKLDYLMVLSPYRKKGYGGMLMDWAMKFFSEKGIAQIEVKVVAGNEAIHLYEKYGFKINAHILWRTYMEQ